MENNKTQFSPELQNKILDVVLELEPLLQQLPKKGKNNYQNYLQILSCTPNSDMLKFTAICLMNCPSVNKAGLIAALKIIDGGN